MRAIYIFLLVVMILLIAAPTWAGGDKVIQKTNVDTTSSVSNDIAGDKSRALSLSGGDMDINEDYRSYSYLFGLIQETKSNPLSVARSLMMEGNYKAAAVLRCQPWGVHKAFGGKDECIEALSHPMVRPVEPEPEAAVDDDEDEDYHSERVAALEMQLTAQQQLFEEWQAEEPPVQIQRVVEKIGYSDEQRSQVQAVLE